MNITSFYFLCFYAVVLILYYAVPKQLQWLVLLAGSIAFYLLGGSGWLILYPLATSAVCFVSGYRLSKAEDGRRKKAWLCFSLAGTLGVLVVLIYFNFGIYTYNGLVALFQGRLFQGKPLDALQFLIPLGVSFYTLSLLGYVLDIYYGIGKVSTNFFKFTLYGMFFPAMISGPIMRFKEMEEELYRPHPLRYDQVTKGLQRMVWGFFKKLVIAERAALIVNTVYDDYSNYEGAYFWIAAVCFVIQLATDFSGYMDIVLGLAQTFGITLPENFRTPFLSKSIAEYWRRWHMTLGSFMKDYVFYPLLRSQLFVRIGNSLRSGLGKKNGKRLTTFLAMFILWFTVGIWHGGGWKYILGAGLFHWGFIVAGELVEPVFARWMKNKGRDPHHKVLDGLRVCRTFLLVTLADVFFRADSARIGFRIWKSMFSVWNPAVLVDGSLFTLGLDWIEFTVGAVSVVILILVSLLKEKGGGIRDRIAAKPLPVRWLIWYALLFYTILLGYYGPDYDAAEFIYQGF